MVAKIYLTSTEGRSGKSSVALGALDALASETPRVGVFRPLIRSGEERDRVLEVLLTRVTADLSYEECVGVTYEQFNNDPDSTLKVIVDRYKALEAKVDAVVIVGSDYTDVAAPTELTMNARIAANLDAPVLLVLGGRASGENELLGQSAARSPQDLASLAEIACHQLSAEHARLLATVINRADPDQLDAITAAVRGVLTDAPVWAIPENQLLVAPQVSAVLESTGGTLERGDAELLDREVMGIVVAGMGMERVLHRLTEGAVVVVAADRTETLLAITIAHEAENFPTIAAVVLNGDFPMNEDVARLLDGIGSPLPVIRVNLGTYDTVRAVGGARGLLSPKSPRKFDTALSLFHTHVDVDELRSRVQVDRGSVLTPTMYAYDLFERARKAKAHIVLPEGSDDRILRAASTLLARKLVTVTILGDEAEVRKRAGELGLALGQATVIDPLTSPLRDEFAREYARLRGLCCKDWRQSEVGCRSAPIRRLLRNGG